jgi:RNA polymerase sigma factor (sigma-70 family)
MSTHTNNTEQSNQLTDEQAKLVESHRALAASIARGFIGRGIDTDDLISIAHLALVRAARNFDTNGEAPFAAYGASWVRHCIIHELHAMVCDRAACPSSQQKLLSTARRAARSFALKHGREPHAAELAAELEVSTDRAASLLGLLHAHKSSISDTPTGSPDARTMDPAAPAETSSLEAITQRERRKMLSRALENLPPPQAEAVARRFGLGGCAVQSIQEVAAGLGVTVGQAQQLIRNALGALGSSLRTLAA